MPKNTRSGQRVSAISSGEADYTFLTLLLRSLCKDRDFFRRAVPLLPADFFEPPSSTDPGEYARWVIADIAKEYYAAHKVPIGALIGTHVRRFIKRNNVQQMRAEALQALAVSIQQKKVADREALLRELAVFSQAHAVDTAVADIQTQYESGGLTMDTLREAVAAASSKAVTAAGQRVADYFSATGFADRQLARKLTPTNGTGVGIFEIDMHLNRIGEGHVVVVMAPAKRGKTMLLQHAAVHSALYSHYVGFATLEVLKPDLTSRLDCYTTGMTYEEIEAYPKRAERRYKKYAERVACSGGRLFIVDSNDLGGNTIAHLEAFIHRCKEEGHALNSLFVDYDEFLFPNVRVKDNPVERYNLLYLEAKRLATENRLTFWIAAQTQRNTDQQKILTMNHAAQDMGKIRKADLVLGIGNGEDYDENAVYIHIVENRHGRAKIGQYCITDRARSMIYDFDATYRALRENPADVSNDDA